MLKISGSGVYLNDKVCFRIGERQQALALDRDVPQDSSDRRLRQR